MIALTLLKSPITWIVAAVLATAVALTAVYDKGESAASADATAAVEHTTDLAIEKARKDKDAADEKVRTSAPDAVIDSTR
jgi:hypothetical protein